MTNNIKADLDEMVFVDRERGYGAYFLRKNYASYLLYASLAVMAIFLLLSIVPNTALFSGEGDVIKKRELVTEVKLMEMLDEEPEQDMEEEEPPPPPLPPPPPKLEVISQRIPVPIDADELDEEDLIHEMDSLVVAVNIGFKDVDGDSEIIADWIPNGNDDVPAVIAEKYPDSRDFIVPQVQPKERNLSDIKRAIGYPEVARDANIEGLVIARVLVDKHGDYKKHKITKKAHPILQEAVEKQLHKLRFTPAIQGGKPIAFWVNIPFRFSLL